ncbi:uncharacterized protein LOC136029100 isoform X2 [Artemia franciscana]|uniref:Uncharacterized protein n=1 Tax=Artemia franciscana TaxID=6661 RepID=A0AA88HCE6_ARTSF|nr:hypothetical protein QYM36_015472 [Artemia franciscana]
MSISPHIRKMCSIEFSPFLPLLDPEKLEDQTEGFAAELSHAKTDEHFDYTVKFAIEQQVKGGQHFIEEVVEDMKLNETPGFLKPSLYFSEMKFYCDWMNIGYGGSFAGDGRTLTYFISGPDLCSVSSYNSKMKNYKTVFPSAVKEGPIEQILCSKEYLVVKSAFEINVYNLNKNESIHHFQHEKPIQRVAIAHNLLNIAFVDSEGINIFFEGTLRKAIPVMSIYDIVFVGDFTYRYSAGFKVFEVDALNCKDTVFDTAILQKPSSVCAIRESVKNEEILYYFTQNDVYCVRKKARQNFISSFQHFGSHSPTYFSIAAGEDFELILFSSAVGRVQVIVCQIGEKTVNFVRHFSLDTIAQTLKNCKLEGGLHPKFSASNRLTSPIVGIFTLIHRNKIRILIQNVFGDLFCSRNKNLQKQDVLTKYKNWLEKFEEQSHPIVTGIVELPDKMLRQKEETCLFDFDSDDEYWNIDATFTLET